MAPETKSKPVNILFILSDDQGAWAMGCAGNSEIKTPNLDLLARTGMRFENFFCASPVCSPARATLLTGRIPSQHGVHDWIAAGNTFAQYEPARNGELIEYLKGQVGYTDLLASVGYRCGISGKWHLGDAHHPQKGFEFWAVHAKGGAGYFNAPMISNGELREEPAYVTNAITNHALRWLEEQKGDGRPFYLSVHYTAPHSPWSRENHPAELFDDYYHHCPFSHIPDGQKPPEWVRHVSIPIETSEQRRTCLSGYHAAVTAMDANIGRLINWLESNNLREETLIVFTSDNGMNMGHHGVYGKGNATFPLNMFEESVKVPFLVSHPGLIEPGTVCRHLVSQYDFMPTLLDYAGHRDLVPPGLPGKSFAPTLLGQQGQQEGEFVVVFDEYGSTRMIRNREWKYVHRFPRGPHELYHLETDPAELRNLVGSRVHRSVERELRRNLIEWFALHVAPERDGEKQNVSGGGQIGLCATVFDGMDPFLSSSGQPVSRHKPNQGPS